MAGLLDGTKYPGNLDSLINEFLYTNVERMRHLYSWGVRVGWWCHCINFLPAVTVHWKYKYRLFHPI